MKDDEVIEKLKHDVSSLELPPISEKVYQAVRERRKNIPDTTHSYFNTKKSHRPCTIKSLFAAAFLMLAVLVPAIIGIINNNSYNLNSESIVSSNSENTGISESQTAEIVNSGNTLEQIKLKQLYGEVALSDKSKEELDMFFVTHPKENNVYEDKKYIYNFDHNGRLIEICRIAEDYNNGDIASKQDISNKIKALLEEYCPDYQYDMCDINIIENTDCRPAWFAYITNGEDDTEGEKITITFDETGTMLRLSIVAQTDDIGKISRAEAFDIALSELRSERYSLTSFRDEDIDIIAEAKISDNETHYFISVFDIPLKGNIKTGFCVEVNADTGDILNVFR